MNQHRKFRTLEDVYQSGIPYNPEEGQFEFDHLNEAYSDIHRPLNEAVTNPILSVESIAAITGVDGNLFLNYYRAANLDYALSHVGVSIGSPSYRAINQDIHGKNYNVLEKFVSKIINNNLEKPLIITTASKNRKLRSPVGGRICAWDGLEGMEEILMNPAEHPINGIRKGAANLMRCLAIVHLIHTYPNSIVQVERVPAGISYEADQIESFNKSLEDLPPLPLILPGSRDLYLDKGGKLALIDGAADVKGTPKADLALTLDGKPVFWISFKHGKYVEDATKPEHISFQQWGSHMGIYKQEEFKPLLDKYMTGVSESLGQYYSREQAENAVQHIDDPVEGSVDDVLQKTYNDHFNKRTKSGDLDNSSSLNKHGIDHIHVFSSGTPVIVNKLFDSDKKALGSKLELIALKAIYGDDYSPSNRKLGKNNVNILLQTPESGTFEVVKGTPDDPDEIWAIEMKMNEDAHIIKNPDLPNAIPYLPCLYTRYTYASPIIFTNVRTKRQEAIVGGRLLLYPQGRVKDTSTLINVLD